MRGLDRDGFVSTIERWLLAVLENCADLSIEQVAVPDGGGYSAETTLIDVRCVEDGKPRRRELVLRRQIEGSDLFLNSDLGWQWNVMKAMAGRDGVPVPVLVALERDRSLLGAPFYVMERMPGRTVPQRPNYNLSGWLADLAPHDRARVWRNNVEAIARVHHVNWRDGFEFLSRDGQDAPGLDQYLRHVEDWHRWAAAGRELPVLDAAVDWLRRNRPADSPVSVLWGDPIPANTLFAENLDVAGLIDWEMAALGPGEIDLAWFLMFDDFFSVGMNVPRLSGLPAREEIIAIYEAEAGHPVRELDYYEMLAITRLAIIMVRGFDRQVGLGNITSRSKALTHNPTMAMLAHRLGLPVPEVGADFAELVAAAGKQERK